MLPSLRLLQLVQLLLTLLPLLLPLLQLMQLRQLLWLLLPLLLALRLLRAHAKQDSIRGKDMDMLDLLESMPRAVDSLVRVCSRLRTGERIDLYEGCLVVDLDCLGIS